MDEWYSFVNGRLVEERAYAQQARLARQMRRADKAARIDEPALLAGLRARLGHLLISIGHAVEGGRSHPHVPASGAR